jgi:plasmid stabilization system protein ParE
MNEPILTLYAERDVERIVRRLRRVSRLFVDRFLAELDSQAQFYAQFPDLGIPRADLRPGFRCFLVGRYVAFYRAMPGTILVVRILHGSTNARAILGRP